MSEKMLLTINDVAERLSISRTQCYELVRAGELPSVRFRRSVRVPVAELDAFIRERAGEARMRAARSRSGKVKAIRGA